MLQCRFGSHGDYEAIALCPSSVQECFDFMIEAFNLAEAYRVPVFFMMDECVGHMTEKLVIPDAREISVLGRRFTKKPPEEFLPYAPGEDLVPEMVKAGDGYRFHVTGLTHDERGYPSTTLATQRQLVVRLIEKIQRNAPKIWKWEERNLQGAEVAVISYGISARVALKAIELAKQDGIQAGLFRLITVWPFPGQRIQELAMRVRAIVVPELNLRGQVANEVERAVQGRCPVVPVGHPGGGVHDPQDIFHAIKEALS
jgi:2-oxoglutarate ferredoxin oxidoreductase subunit alpha